MKSAKMTGIIDIGSHTVRLAVYRLSPGGGYRIIDQRRWAARLSRKRAPDGRLPDEAAEELAALLVQYVHLCRKHGADHIRAVATAAVRTASNRDEVVRRLSRAAGIGIEVLTGEEEARCGSLAMQRTLNLADGYIVDIGGGSTEVTLLKNRQIIRAVSFPVGCTNTIGRYGLGDGPVPAPRIEEIRRDLSRLLGSQSWMSGQSGLPLIGLGGTVRAFAKLRQRETDYPFPSLRSTDMNNPKKSLPPRWTSFPRCPWANAASFRVCPKTARTSSSRDWRF